MRPWGEFLLSKGYTVRVPLLPGHGTKPEDLNKVKWQEWPAKVQSELEELLKACDQVFICGLSMGGAPVNPWTRSTPMRAVFPAPVADQSCIHPAGAVSTAIFLFHSLRRVAALCRAVISPHSVPK